MLLVTAMAKMMEPEYQGGRDRLRRGGLHACYRGGWRGLRGPGRCSVGASGWRRGMASRRSRGTDAQDGLGFLRKGYLGSTTTKKDRRLEVGQVDVDATWDEGSWTQPQVVK